MCLCLLREGERQEKKNRETERQKESDSVKEMSWRRNSRDAADSASRFGRAAQAVTYFQWGSAWVRGGGPKNTNSHKSLPNYTLVFQVCRRSSVMLFAFQRVCITVSPPVPILGLFHIKATAMLVCAAAC